MPISSFSCWLAVLRLFSLSSFFCFETILPICQYERMVKKNRQNRKKKKKLFKRDIESDGNLNASNKCQRKTTSSKRWINQTINSFRQYIYAKKKSWSPSLLSNTRRMAASKKMAMKEKKRRMNDTRLT
jgi:hypothetical protein